MKLSSLQLQQFRSYSSLHLDTSESLVHVFVGPNGAGKTNILESVSVLSRTKSCLHADEQSLMQWGEDFYRVRATVQSDTDEASTLEVTSQMQPRKAKACFKNDVKQSVTHMIGQLPTVIFLPQELQLFTGSPGNRRSFLDQLLCQVSTDYLHALVQYQKILKQRNILLRRIAEGKADAAQLELWNEELAIKGVYVTLRRLELVEVLQCTIEQEVHMLGEQKWANVHILYERKGKERDDPAAKAEYVRQLEQAQTRDIALQSTTVGPHREDWRIEVDGRPLHEFASRGQQRTAVLALLFLEVSYLELARSEKPVILLDDVFSELDDHHQRSLLDSLKEHQVFITGTHVPASVPDDVQVWRVEDGAVTKAPSPFEGRGLG